MIQPGLGPPGNVGKPRYSRMSCWCSDPRGRARHTFCHTAFWRMISLRSHRVCAHRPVNARTSVPAYLPRHILVFSRTRSATRTRKHARASTRTYTRNYMGIHAQRHNHNRTHPSNHLPQIRSAPFPLSYRIHTITTFVRHATLLATALIRPQTTILLAIAAMRCFSPESSTKPEHLVELHAMLRVECLAVDVQHNAR